MRFYDYFQIIKINCKESISNEDLFILLVDSIIIPMQLQSTNGEMPEYSKGRVSEFLNGRRALPALLRDNVYNEKVTTSIVEYFDDYIVRRLTPNREDICYQIMQLVDKDSSISPSTKASMEMLAKPATLSALLAQVFPYAIRSSGKELSNNDNTINAVPFHICGIHPDESIGLDFVIEDFTGSGSHSSKEKRAKLFSLYKDINALHLNDTSKKSPASISLFSSMYTPVSINSNIQEEISQCAQAIEVEMSEDFFYLGDLVKNQFNTASIITGGSNIEGSEIAKKKYSLIHELHNHIYDCMKWFPIEAHFRDMQVIRLAISNDGTSPDQNITVTLEFNKNTIMKPQDLLGCKLETLDDLISDYDPFEFFGIPRGPNHLDYDSTIKNASSKTVVNSIRSPFMSNARMSREELLSEFEDIFDYYYCEKDEKTLVTVEFDEVMHNTSVAFPTVLFIKESIDTIRYTIKTRNQPAPITGEIHLSN